MVIEEETKSEEVTLLEEMIEALDELSASMSYSNSNSNIDIK